MGGFLLDASVEVDDSLDPADVVGHFGINAVLAAFTAAFAEASDPKNCPPVPDRT